MPYWQSFQPVRRPAIIADLLDGGIEICRSSSLVKSQRIDEVEQIVTVVRRRQADPQSSGPIGNAGRSDRRDEATGFEEPGGPQGRGGRVADEERDDRAFTIDGGEPKPLDLASKIACENFQVPATPGFVDHQFQSLMRGGGGGGG